MEYRCVATSVEGFVQQLAVAYITHGYWFYVTGNIPRGKDPTAVDAKLIERYAIAISKWARCRRKKQGLASIHYLRYRRFFVLSATKGRHEFFLFERAVIRDVRRIPLKFAGYSISVKRGIDGRLHPSVRIHPDELRKLRAYLLELAPRRSVDSLSAVLASVPFEPYAPIRRQLLNILRGVNRVRNAAGLEPVPIAALRLRRSVAIPFRDGREVNYATKVVID